MSSGTDRLGGSSTPRAGVGGPPVGVRAARRRPDTGQSSLMLLPAAIALMTATLLIVTITADGFGKQSRTVTAADAAALAAAVAWRDQLESRWMFLSGADPALARVLARNLLRQDVRSLGVTSGSRARSLAAANSGVVERLTITPTPRGLEFHVAGRSAATLRGSSDHARAEATARLDFSRGPLCWRGNGLHLGLFMNGRCRGPDDPLLGLTPAPPGPPGFPGPPGPPGPSPSPAPGWLTGPDPDVDVVLVG